MPDVSARLAALPPEQRALLVQRLAARRAAAARPGTGSGSIPRRPSDAGPAPLSSLQERLWVLDQWEGGASTAYNLPAAFRLRGELDVGLLRAALGGVLARHDSLRTTFAAQDGIPYQVIAAPADVDLPVTDLSGLPPAEREAELLRAAAAEVARPFDLQRGPLIRFRLLRAAADDHLLVLPMHHSVSDGYSVGLVIGELAELYAAAGEGRPAALPTLPVQYADYAAWQRDWIRAGGLEQQLEWWAERLEGAASVDLPTDRPRPPAASSRGRKIVHRLGEALVDRLRALSRAQDVTLFMILTSALQVVLCRYTGQEDMVVGTASAGRTRPELERLVGFFTNMVVLRTDLTGDPTFAELLERVRDSALGAYQHQEVPFDRVVERVQNDRDLARSPIFQVAMDLQPAGQLGFALPGLTAELVSLQAETARFDIAINGFEDATGIDLWLEYATDLFDEPRIRRLLGHLEQVLSAVADHPRLRLSEVPLLTDDERRQLLEWGVGEPREHPPGPVHRMIAAQAARTPAAIAAVAEEGSLTYAELERRADLVARRLRSVGVGHEDVVAVALERGLDLVVALVGVLKASAAFVSLDLDDPSGRTRFVLADTSARAVVTTGRLCDRLPDLSGQAVVLVEEAVAATEELASVPLPDEAGPDSLVYVLYTSGSTGTPKGVLIEHRGLANFICYLSTICGVGPGARAMQYTSLVFDLAEGEIFTALTQGATLVLPSAEQTAHASALSELMRRERVTYLGSPPAMLSLMEPEPYPDLRYVLVGGEAFPGELVTRWNLPGRRFVNGYGPTEVTIGCTYYICEHKTWTAAPPIGRSQPNRVTYLVDRWDNLVPVGVPGELLSGGPGVARGYLNQPELTAGRFVADPFRPGERVYRTGDLCLWTEDGQIQFLGRIDAQVQLRGMRIEPGEVEAALASHPAVGQVAVVLREDHPGDKRLVAYVVPTGDADAAGYRKHLAERLPAYMVPSAFVPLPALPLLPNGKVDRRALPTPEIAAGGAAFVPPRTETERQLAAAFAEVLGAEEVGAQDDFFTLGGNSLQATRVVARVRQALGVDLPVRSFFTVSTVAGLARVVDELPAASPAPAAPAGGDSGAEEAIAAEIAELERQLAEAREQLDRSRSEAAGAHRVNGARPAAASMLLLTLTPTGAKPPIYAVHSVSGSGYSYRGLAQALGPEQPFHCFEAPGLDTDEPPVDRIEELAARYVAAMREHQPTGPYLLLGYSMGGFVVVEMALQLATAGAEVRLLALIDPPAPAPAEPPDRAGTLQLFADNLAAALGRPPVRLDPALAAAPEPRQLDGLLAELRRVELLPAEVGRDFLRRRLAVFSAHVRAIWTYRPSGRFRGTLALLRAAESDDTRAAWAQVADEIDDQVVPGDHYTLWAARQLPGLAATLRERIDRQAVGKADG